MLPVKRYRATVAYDGTDFSGWQIQPGQRTVQLELEQALTALTGHTARVNCSGRTDAGVHARGQVVRFDLATRIPLARFKLACNSKLPPDVRMLTLQTVRPDFDARFSATGKEYRYFIWNDAQLLPDVRRFRYHVRVPLDVRAMRRAARLLEGRHDFAAFCANPGYEREGTVRRLYALRVTRRGPEVTMVARGRVSSIRWCGAWPVFWCGSVWRTGARKRHPHTQIMRTNRACTHRPRWWPISVAGVPANGRDKRPACLDAAGLVL